MEGTAVAMTVASIATSPVVSMTAMSTGPRSDRKPTPGETSVTSDHSATDRERDGYPGSAQRSHARILPGRQGAAREEQKGSAGATPCARLQQEHACAGHAGTDDQHRP